VQKISFRREPANIGFTLICSELPGDRVLIDEVMPLSAAYRAGLRRGQRLVQVGSISVTDAPLETIHALLNEPGKQMLTLHVVIEAMDSDV
jgi:C-terminal processing protease CtpA/Prc